MLDESEDEGVLMPEEEPESEDLAESVLDDFVSKVGGEGEVKEEGAEGTGRVSRPKYEHSSSLGGSRGDSGQLRSRESSDS